MDGNFPGACLYATDCRDPSDEARNNGVVERSLSRAARPWRRGRSPRSRAMAEVEDDLCALDFGVAVTIRGPNFAGVRGFSFAAKKSPLLSSMLWKFTPSASYSLARLVLLELRTRPPSRVSISVSLSMRKVVCETRSGR